MPLPLLMSVLSPPTKPQGPGRPEGWSEVERRLGTALPSDYKAFVEHYGSGSICDFVVVLNPFASNRNIDLIERGKRQRSALEELKAEFPDSYPHPVYPAPGGLLPFAITDNGDVFHWKTEGAPEAWTIVVYEGRGTEFREFPGSMTDFLTGLLSKSLVLDVLPAGFPRAPASFSPSMGG
jgi:hypothetical protein